MKPVIVGIDFGVTSSLAILDLNGELIHVKTRRNFSPSLMKKEIIKFGKPLIIGTDKKTPSPRVIKIASSFGSKIFHPKRNILVKDKLKVTKKIKFKNTHERDAIASAKFAFKSHASQFDNIDKTLYNMDLEKYSDNIKEMILTKKAKNIDEATKRIKFSWRKEAEKFKKRFREKQRSYDILKIYTDFLEEKLKQLKKQRKELLEEEKKKNQETRKRVIFEKEIVQRDILIKQLQFELNKQRNIIKAYEELE